MNWHVCWHYIMYYSSFIVVCTSAFIRRSKCVIPQVPVEVSQHSWFPFPFRHVLRWRDNLRGFLSVVYCIRERGSTCFLSPLGHEVLSRKSFAYNFDYMPGRWISFSECPFEVIISYKLTNLKDFEYASYNFDISLFREDQHDLLSS